MLALRWPRVLVWLVVSTLLIGVFGCQGSGSAPAKEKPVVPIKIAYGRIWTAPALFVGKDKGYFDKPGIETTWVEINAPPQVLEGIAAGQIQIGGSTDTTIAIGRDKGVKVKAVALLAGQSDPPTSYLVRKDAGIKGVQDLKGKTIAVQNYTGQFDLYLREHLSQNGIDPTKDVKIIEMPLDAIAKSLMAKQIDAGSLPYLFVSSAMADYGDQLQVLFTYKDVAVLKGQANTMVILMSDNFIGQNREAAKAFLKGYLEAVDFTIKNPKEALDSWIKVTEYKALANSKGIPYLPADAKIDLNVLKINAELLYKFGYTKRVVGVEEMVDHTLIDEVMGKK